MLLSNAFAQDTLEGDGMSLIQASSKGVVVKSVLLAIFCSDPFCDDSFFVLLSLSSVRALIATNL